jgi:hypothetical protein
VLLASRRHHKQALGYKRMNAHELLAVALEKLGAHSLVDELEALETVLVYIKNVIMFPGEKKYRKVKVRNIHYQVCAAAMLSPPSSKTTPTRSRLCLSSAVTNTLTLALSLVLFLFCWLHFRSG